jgi:hypothetical protein
MYSDLIKIVIITFVFFILNEPGMIFDWYQKLIIHLPEWLWKPLGGCIRCLTGQVLFWFYLIKYFHCYNFINHIFFVSLGILIVTFLYNFYGLTQDRL